MRNIHTNPCPDRAARALGTPSAAQVNRDQPEDSPDPDGETDVAMTQALLSDLETLTRCVEPLTAIYELIDRALPGRPTK